MYNIIMAVVWTRGTNDDGKRATPTDDTNNKKRKLFSDVTTNKAHTTRYKKQFLHYSHVFLFIFIILYILY